MAVIGDLVVKLGLDNSRFDRGISQSQSRMQRAGKAIGSALAGIGVAAAGMATAAAAAFAGMVRNAFSTLDSLGKMSDRLGIAVGQLQGLQHAANLSGMSISQLEMGLQRMTRRVAEAGQGLGEAQGALNELGLDAGRLNQLSPDQQLLAIAQALEGVESQSDKIRLAFKLFDSEGVGMLQILDDGVAGMQEMIREGERLNGTLTRMDISQIEAANDSWTRMKTAVQGVANAVAVNLAPTVSSALDEMAEGFRHWEDALDGALLTLHRVAPFMFPEGAAEHLAGRIAGRAINQGRAAVGGGGIPDVAGVTNVAAEVAEGIDKASRSSGAAIAQRSKFGPAVAEQAGTAPGLASGALRGSREAASAMARFSRPGNTVEDRQLEEERKIETNTKRAAEALRNLQQSATPVIFGLHSEQGLAF